MRTNTPRLFGAGACLTMLGLTLAACGSSGSHASTATTEGSSTAATPGVPQDRRDVRYCEVIPSVQQAATVTTYVYNTLNYNYCPPNQWKSLTQATVNQEYGSQSAQLNGPRHFVMDEASASGASTTGKTFTFGGIEMGLRATLTTAAGQPTVGNRLYTPNQVARDTVWTYRAGKPIFELIDPNGDTYVMQSYAQIADKTLTIKQLPDLAKKLQLPQGWTYKTVTLTQDLQLNSNGLATVVNDNLYDSYQKG